MNRHSRHARAERAIEALLYSFVLAVLAVGFLAGLACARLAGWGEMP